MASRFVCVFNRTPIFSCLLDNLWKLILTFCFHLHANQMNMYIIILFMSGKYKTLNWHSSACIVCILIISSVPRNDVYEKRLKHRRWLNSDTYRACLAFIYSWLKDSKWKSLSDPFFLKFPLQGFELSFLARTTTLGNKFSNSVLNFRSLKIAFEIIFWLVLEGSLAHTNANN